MDRDKRWERIKVAYDAMVHRKGEMTTNIFSAVTDSYKNDVTDEFLKPIINAETPDSEMMDGDAVMCFNFRTDRCREITEALTQTAFPEYDMKPLKLDYTTMTLYDHNFKNIHVIFQKDDLVNTLGEVLMNNHKKQIRIAETEKYPHVTFFFSGGREVPFEG
jgi:2,3-bisphosphoglycerate-independent phosphoglycerate mutase